MNFDDLCNNYLKTHIFNEAPAAPTIDPDIEEPDIEEPVEEPKTPPAPVKPSQPKRHPLLPTPGVKPRPMAGKSGLSPDVQAMLNTRK